MGRGTGLTRLSRAKLERLFPNLKRTQYAITSAETAQYNCIAWAVGDSARWWWPVHHPMAYWPPNVTRRVHMDAFLEAFKTLDFERCPDGDPERGWEKLAIYADTNGEPKHAARQLPSGRWTSKLGPLEDVNHLLYGLIGREYGDIVIYMKRRLRPSPP